MSAITCDYGDFLSLSCNTSAKPFWFQGFRRGNSRICPLLSTATPDVTAWDETCSSLPLLPLVSFVVNGFGFQFWQLPDFGNSGDLFLRPSACVPQPRPPPPHRALLKTKTKVQFDRAVTERSKALLPVFQPSNRAQFQPCFLVPGVRSAEGRKPLQVPALANWQLPALIFKERPPHNFFALERIPNFTICSP